MKRGSILLAIVFTIVIPAIIAWPALRIAGSWKAGQEAVRSSYGALRRLAINSINLPTRMQQSTEWTDAARKAWNDDAACLPSSSAIPQVRCCMPCPKLHRITQNPDKTQKVRVHIPGKYRCPVQRSNSIRPGTGCIVCNPAPR
jgi:hypothetical protein